MLETADKPRRLQLKLDINEANIDELERQSCEEIFLAREREYRDSYRHIPALGELKGYFDRVWGPGIAFERDLAKGSIRPLLTHIKFFGVVTTYGSPWWITRIIAGDPGRKVLMKALKPMCGRRVRSFLLAQYDLDRSTQAARATFIAQVRARIGRI